MYRYTVNFWDELKNEPATDSGLVGGSTYGEAANRVVDYYGQKNVVDITLYEVESVLCDDELADMNVGE